MKKLSKLAMRLGVTVMVLMLGVSSTKPVLAADGECYVSGGIGDVDDHFLSNSFTITQERYDETCYFPGSCIDERFPVTLSVDGIEYVGDEDFDGQVDLEFFNSRGNSVGPLGAGRNLTVNNGAISTTVNLDEGENYTAKVSYTRNFGGGIIMICTIRTSGKFSVSNSCDENSCQTSATNADKNNSYDLCLQQINDPEPQARCIECFNNGGIWTAVGCIPQTKEGIISTIMEIGLTLSGAVVLVMILVGSFMLSTSQGDPKKTQEAKEMITSAIIGLLFVIFSITILQFIGVSIIRIPGFGQ